MNSILIPEKGYWMQIARMQMRQLQKIDIQTKLF